MNCLQKSLILALSAASPFVFQTPAAARSYAAPSFHQEGRWHSVALKLLLDAGIQAYQQGDYTQALSLFRQAAARGHGKAPRYIGLCYEKGLGVAQDLQEAVEWYRKAAAKGDITGAYLLARCYEKGNGVPQDLALAHKYYQQSAQRGDIIAAPAMTALGRLAEQGVGEPKDPAKAKTWYAKADAAGYAPAHEALTKLLGHEPKVHMPRVLTERVSAGSSRDLADGVTRLDVTHIWKPVRTIDFSSKHNVLIQNPDGTTVPMDQPWFASAQIAPGTWQIRSDGDYCYLLEGDSLAVMIDCGYGAGNIRQYAQTLTAKPVQYVINTHYHFDHTANDAYFDAAFMTPESVEYATIPYASFQGITFPRDYPVITVQNGYKLDLGNRELDILTLPHANHTLGGLMVLDPSRKILFTGDEFLGNDKIDLHISLEDFAANMERIGAVRSQFDVMYGGPGKKDASVFDVCAAATRAGLDPDLKTGPSSSTGFKPQPAAPAQGTMVYRRGGVRPGDGTFNAPESVIQGIRRSFTVNGFQVNFMEPEKK